MNIKRYEIKQTATNNYELYLYLDEQDTEFAEELGSKQSKSENVINSAKNIIKNKYPNIKVTMVRVILGGMVVSSLQLGMITENKAEASTFSTTQNQSTEDIYYQVKEGDSLWLLAQRYQSSVDAIKQANHLSTNSITVNQKLVIPKATHTVGVGDYLTVLAKKYGVSVGSIKEANQLVSDETRLGQVLYIPAIVTETNTNTTSETTNPSLEPQLISTYIVQAGDSLSVLAARYGTTVDSIKAANQLTTNLIRVGQELTIPVNKPSQAESTAPTAQTPTPQVEDQKATTYTVKSGDSLSVIAARYGTTVDSIKAANQLTTNLIQVGQELSIPVNKPSQAESTAPTAQTPTPQVEDQKATTYTVKSGDSLSVIAARYGTTVDSIKEANQLTTNLIRVGQELTIPVNKPSQAESTAPTEQTPTPQVEDQKATTYTVKSGDSLSVLAARYGTTVDSIKAANNLPNDIIQIGQVLTIPGKADTTSKTEESTTPIKETTDTKQEQRTTFVYSVSSGDNLSVIADRFSVSTDSIRKANNLKSDVLQIGQNLTIPNGIVGEGVNTITYKTHTVQSGDNIWDLSIKYGIPQSELLRTNNLSTTSSLKIGQKLKIPVHNIAVKQVVSKKYGEYLDWWTEAQYIFTIGTKAKVTDLATGKSFYIQRTVGANHADSETSTKKDTDIAKNIWGGFSWTPRAVTLEINGRKIAASMSFMPHEREYISGNGITGHFDVYFGNSTRHKDGLPDTSHQKQVERAAGLR